MQRSRPETCLSDLVLDRVVAGEIEPPPHLASCDACSARLAELRSDVEKLPEQVWVAGEARKVKRRLPMLGIAAALSAAAAAALVFTRAVEAPPSLRTKGGLALSLFAKHDGGKVEELLPGARLRAGDAVRFSVSTVREGYVAVVGLDAAGEVTLHAAPEAPLPAGKGQLLEGSVVLDEAVGPERFVAVLCEHAPGGSRVRDAARTALAAAGGDPRRAGELRIDCAQVSFLVEKVK
jgi:hypothetical protein